MKFLNKAKSLIDLLAYFDILDWKHLHSNHQTIKLLKQIISQYLNEGRCYKEQKSIIIIYVKNCSVVSHCHCPGYVQFHWSFCLKFSTVDRWSETVSLFNEVFYRQGGVRNVLVCIISNSFDLHHFISFEIMLRCPSVHIHVFI